MQININYYMAKKTKLLPKGIDDGSVYYVQEDNSLYIDAFNTRNKINPSQTWTTVKTSPTWEEIINNPNYAIDYELGMTQVFHMSGMTPVDVIMELVAFDTDIRDDGDMSINNGKAKMTWITKDIYITSSPNSNSFVYIWRSSDVRSNLEHNLNNFFPEILANNIIQVKKTTQCWNGSFYPTTTSDKLWVPSRNEIFGDSTTYENDGVTYADYYIDSSKRIKEYYLNPSIKSWALRSVNSDNSSYKCGIDNSGNMVTINTETSEAGIVFGFCL